MARPYLTHRSPFIRAAAVLVVLGFVALLLGGSTLKAQEPPAGPQIYGDLPEPTGISSPYTDARDANNPNPSQPTDEQLEALTEFVAQLGKSVRREYSPANGTLSKLTGVDAALSSPDSRSPSSIARDFLHQISRAGGFSASFVDGLSEVRNTTTPNTGLTSIDYQQTVGGLPVFQGYARIGVAADGRVLSYGANLHPGLVAPSDAPALSTDDAVAAAEALVGPSAKVPDGASGPGIDALRRMFEPRVRGLIFPTPGTPGVLAWEVQINQFQDLWYLIVDANTGQLLYQGNLVNDVDPQGLVFTEHPDAGGQTIVPFLGTIAGHTAWVELTADSSGCATCTAGNNVTSIVGQNLQLNGSLPGAFFINGGVNSDFATPAAFTWTNAFGTGGNLDDDSDVAAINAFYFNNFAHDFFYELGFTESAGNFQSENGANGGLELDNVLSVSQLGFDVCLIVNLQPCRNNAFFSTPPDGQQPLMAMFAFTAPFPNRDGALDGDVVYHEFGHGVSNRLVGGPANVNALNGIQSGAMGEGWSDYWAVSIYNDPVMGEYVTGNTVRGIRTFAYNTHPWTYSHLCTTNFGGGPQCEVHADGEIWAATLYDMLQNLISQHGLAAGTALSDQLVIDGMKLVQASPDMLDARDAIIQADVNLNAGANACLLWDAFAGRGMGFSASTSGHNDNTVADAFDLPVACAPNPGELSFASTAQAVSENAGTATFQVQRTGGDDGAVSVQCVASDGTANTPADYSQTTAATVSWADGDSANKPCTVSIVDDGDFEPNETVNFALSGAVGATINLAADDAVLTINNNDAAQPGVISFASGAQAVSENAGTATFQVQRTGGDDGAVSVECVASDGTANTPADYSQTTAATVSWADGDSANKPCTVSIVDDGDFEPNETVNFALSGATGGATINGAADEAVLTINNNDAAQPGVVSFASGAQAVSENAGTATFQVQRTGGDDGAVSVQCVASDGTANTPADYSQTTAATVSWADGDSANKPCTVSIVDDGDFEPNETVNFALSGATGGATINGAADEAVLTINNNDAAQQGLLSFVSTSQGVSEGAGTATFQVQRTGGDDGAVSVQCVASDGTATTPADFSQTTAATVSWADGDSASKPCSVSIVNDPDFESDETVNFALSGATGGATINTAADDAVLTITNNDAAQPGQLSFVSTSQSVSEGAGSATFQVQRTGGDDGTVTVQCVASDGSATTPADYSQTTAATVSWTDGDSANKPCTVSIVNDPDFEPDETVNFALSIATGGATIGANDEATLTIANNDAAQPGVLSFVSTLQSVSEGAGTATFQVQRTGGDDGAVSVECTAAGDTAENPDDFTQSPSPAVLNWADGDSANKPCTVSVVNDSNFEPDETVNFALANATGGATIGAADDAVLTINDNDAANAPTQLQITSQPSNGLTTVGLGNIVVEIQNAQGDVVTNADDEVTLGVTGGGSLQQSTGPWVELPPEASNVVRNGSLTCSGGTTVAAVNGIATFTGCSVSNPGIGLTLTASATGLAGDTGGTFDILPKEIDVTCDGEATPVDALATLGKVVGFTAGVPLPGECSTGDVDQDGVPTIGDALLIRLALAGRIL